MSTSHDELGRLLPNMPADVAADVLDFARERMTRRLDLEPLPEDVSASLDRIAGDPKLKARFNTMIDEQLAAVARDESVDGEDFMDELMAGLPK